MKNTQSAKFVKLFSLFMIIGFWMIVNPCVSKAQSKSNSPNIINTVWKMPDIPFDTSSGPAITQVFYLFEKDGKITQRVISALQSQIQITPKYQNPMYNPFPWAYQEGSNPSSINSPNRLELTTTPGFTVQIDEIGKYKQNGKTIYIEFTGNCGNCTQSITATIDNDQMSGNYFSKKTNKSSKWTISKMSIPIKTSQENRTEPSNSSSPKTKENSDNCDAVCQSQKMVKDNNN